MKEQFDPRKIKTFEELEYEIRLNKIRKEVVWEKVVVETQSLPRSLLPGYVRTIIPIIVTKIRRQLSKSKKS